MSFIQSVLLGVLQGIAEFLPVSSSGHLVLARAFMGLEEIPVLFDVILHLATLVVVIWVFRARIGAILAALGRLVVRRNTPDDRDHLILALQLVAASAATAVIGVGISVLGIRDDPVLVSALLIATALVLVSTILARGVRPLEQTGWRSALIMGIAQGFGVFPGISRSGITIASGLLSGLDRRAAGEFSFLLSIPAIFGAFLFSLKDAGDLASSVPPLSLLGGFLAAMIAGYASLRLLLRLVAGGRLWIFAIYLVPVGVWSLVHFVS